MFVIVIISQFFCSPFLFIEVTQSRTTKHLFYQLFLLVVPLFPLFHLKIKTLICKNIYLLFLYIYFLYIGYMFSGGTTENRGTSKRQIRCFNFRKIVKCWQNCFYTNTICRVSCYSCFFCALIIICYKNISALRPRKKSG